MISHLQAGLIDARLMEDDKAASKTTHCNFHKHINYVECSEMDIYTTFSICVYPDPLCINVFNNN